MKITNENIIIELTAEEIAILNKSQSIMNKILHIMKNNEKRTLNNLTTDIDLEVTINIILDIIENANCLTIE